MRDPKYGLITIASIALATGFNFAAAPSRAAGTLAICFANVGRMSGANATIVVSPAGETMRDAGLSGMMARRVLAALKQAGVEKIDYLVNTHFHADHFGATADPATKIPIGTFVVPNSRNGFSKHYPARVQ